jgi:hypothetical protein
MLCDSPPITPSSIPSDAFVTFEVIRHLLNEADRTELAVHISEESVEIPDEIMIRDITWIFVGIDDREVGHTETDFHVPNFIPWT